MKSLMRRTFLKRAALTAVVLGGGTEVYGHALERHWIEVERVPVTLGLPQPMQVAVLGDLHYDPLKEEKYLREVVETVNSLKPDLIIFTGDFITHSGDCLPELTGILSTVQAVHGCYGVIGNHDCNAEEAVTAAMGSVGIRILRNESVPLPGQPGWRLTGVMSMLLGTQNLSALQNSPPESRHILMAHEPDCFDQILDPRVALQISGHTHGGQIRAPFLGALHLPKWGKRYEMGLYRKGDRQLYINRGIGTVGVNVRVNCRPEVTLLEIV